MDRLISLQAAIDTLFELYEYQMDIDPTEAADLVRQGIYLAEKKIEQLPSAEPEIIRCKDCKYQDENWRRVSVRWLPCMDVRTGSNWFCGSAERRTDE